MEGKNDKKISQIQKDLAKLRDDHRAFRREYRADKAKMATKADLKGMASKENLKGMATKEDLKRFATKEDLKRFATKEDLKRFATKEDLKRFATKEDLAAVRQEMATKEDLNRVMAQVVKNTVDIADIREKMATKDELQALRNDTLSGFDKIMAKLVAMEQEIVFGFSRIGRLETDVARHDREIVAIKKHVHLA